jgi:hypothetical protein
LEGAAKEAEMSSSAQEKRDLIAQWAFDARPILGRFHIWLENVEVSWERGEPAKEFTSDISFMEGGMERLFAVTAAAGPGAMRAGDSRAASLRQCSSASGSSAAMQWAMRA